MPSQDKSPRVSVIMSVYNGGKYVDRAIKSIVDQTMCDFEFLIMDDGSSDDSLDKLNRWGVRDARIQVFSQANQGLHCALNVLIAKSRSPYIARMDVDDFSFSTRLAEQCDYLDARPEVDLVASGIVYISEGGRFTSARINADQPDYCYHEIMSLRSNPIVHGSVIFRRRAISRFMPLVYRTRYSQDFDLWYRLLADGKQFGFVPRILYGYQAGSELQQDYQKFLRRFMQRKVIKSAYNEGKLFDNDYCLAKFEECQNVSIVKEEMRKFEAQIAYSAIKHRWLEGGGGGARVVVNQWRRLTPIIMIKVIGLLILSALPRKVFGILYDRTVFRRTTPNEIWLRWRDLQELECQYHDGYGNQFHDLPVQTLHEY